MLEGDVSRNVPLQTTLQKLLTSRHSGPRLCRVRWGQTPPAVDSARAGWYKQGVLHRDAKEP